MVITVQVDCHCGLLNWPTVHGSALKRSKEWAFIVQKLLDENGLGENQGLVEGKAGLDFPRTDGEADPSVPSSLKHFLGWPLLNNPKIWSKASILMPC